MTTSISIKGTHCESCKALIEDIASEIPGISKCTVDFKTGATIIEHDDTIDWPKFQKEIATVGEYSFDVPHADNLTSK